MFLKSTAQSLKSVPLARSCCTVCPIWVGPILFKPVPTLVWLGCFTVLLFAVGR
ncbi:uncharacterized protein BO95DRAFT_284575 [Aspergillus brunneoviolaceus CBS 621.78]|uniref:Uncharacterized protein n=1 Tax=Aspergillus brunneoviolaceus CBS 621.78 TaxID=1450534 RepID=A0ACD1GJL1_9EURO|nr:hypothetical protein BO95DRAFT_284575 [Aspergillus brunneoviolaceus CBS 621.78]RAH49437.1 hypothetical protein BO95DRAFT_284575 [Aspergillus brunneoviolaceus CBS 621.78]